MKFARMINFRKSLRLFSISPAILTILLFPLASAFADNDTCIECHGEKDLSIERDGKAYSLFVDLDKFEASIHGDNECIDCHEDAEEVEDGHHVDELAEVDCSMCHDDIYEEYENSVHAKIGKDGSRNAACYGCHDPHNVLDSSDPKSDTYFFKVPFMCAKCHREGNKAAVAYTGEEHEIIKNYSMSIHGKGLLESGLIVTANCISCHTAHSVLPASDEDSTVNPDHIAKTCAKCHVGILAQFETSIHSPKVNKTDKRLPKCNDCHTSHSVNRVDSGSFRIGIMNQCGKCHEEVAKHYFDSFHGKTSELGMLATAKCFDCHGSHKILPPSDENSTLSEANAVQTCGKCHQNSNANFVKYITHADEHNKDKFPRLYYAFWFMTSLLLGTFAFFGIHTILWFRKSLKEHIKQRLEQRIRVSDPKAKQVQRFDAYSRTLHLMVIISFLSLAITGMTLKFADIRMFQVLSSMLGGYEVTGLIHRFAAVITFAYFTLHIGYLVTKKVRRGVSWTTLFVGERTLVPRWQDAIEFYQTVKWFFGMGPRPEYGRWTYWEKFDYFAVFWGVTIIGSTGLILWLPELFTSLGLPGGWINVATIIHSDEALLATGFIFTIHFFNTHFRPEKFPMDPVIFTGTMSLEEFKEERPREYELAVQEGTLEELLVDPPSKRFVRLARTFGLTCVSIGVLTIILIIYSIF